VRELTATEIITLWETAYPYHPIDRALTILHTAMPGHTRDDLAALPLGKLDSLLLSLRIATFGDRLSGTSRCPNCEEKAEFEISCHALNGDDVTPQRKTFRQGDCRITIRPLNSFDLAAAARESTLQQTRQVLLQRCATELSRQGAAAELESLPPELAATIAEKALVVDPQAEKLLDLTCRTCLLPVE
jgi:hypothetical protein